MPAPPLLPLDARLAILRRSTGVCERESFAGEACFSSKESPTPFGFGVERPEPDLDDEGLGE